MDQRWLDSLIADAELVADANKLRETLDWHPQRSDLHDILRDAWNFFRQH